MAIAYEKLKNRKFDDVVQAYGTWETLLYALGVCCGDDPTDPGDLRFAYEEILRALPTMATVLCSAGFWL